MGQPSGHYRKSGFLWPWEWDRLCPRANKGTGKNWGCRGGWRDSVIGQCWPCAVESISKSGSGGDTFVLFLSPSLHAWCSLAPIHLYIYCSFSDCSFIFCSPKLLSCCFSLFVLPWKYHKWSGLINKRNVLAVVQDQGPAIVSVWWELFGYSNWTGREGQRSYQGFVPITSSSAH